MQSLSTDCILLFSYLLMIPLRSISKSQEKIGDILRREVEQLQNYRLIANGVGIHFSDIDEDISVRGIIKDFGEVTKRINISVSENFLEEADNYAKRHNLSRSALLQKATLDYIHR